MSDDEALLERLAKRARDLRVDDDLLEAMANGERSREPAQLSAEWSERERLELTRAVEPFGDAQVAALVERVGRGAATFVKPRVLPTSPRSWAKRPRAVLGALAMAASIALVATGAFQGGEAALPDMTVSVRSQAQWRGESESKSDHLLHLGAPSARFEVLLRPATPAKDPLSAQAFLVLEPGRVVRAPKELSVEISPEGSVRLQGEGAALKDAIALCIVLRAASQWSDSEALERARTMRPSSSSVGIVEISIDRQAAP